MISYVLKYKGANCAIDIYPDDGFSTWLGRRVATIPWGENCKAATEDEARVTARIFIRALQAAEGGHPIGRFSDGE